MKIYTIFIFFKGLILLQDLCKYTSALITTTTTTIPGKATRRQAEPRAPSARQPLGVQWLRFIRTRRYVRVSLVSSDLVCGAAVCALSIKTDNSRVLVQYKKLSGELSIKKLSYRDISRVCRLVARELLRPRGI